MRRASMTMWDILCPHGLAFPTVEREPSGERLHLLPHPCNHVFVFDVSQYRGDERAHLAHLRLLEPARGHGGRTEADPARVHWRVGVERNGVLVDGDTRAVQR